MIQTPRREYNKDVFSLTNVAESPKEHHSGNDRGFLPAIDHRIRNEKVPEWLRQEILGLDKKGITKEEVISSAQHYLMHSPKDFSIEKRVLTEMRDKFFQERNKDHLISHRQLEETLINPEDDSLFPQEKRSYRFFYHKPYVNCDECMRSRLKCDRCLKTLINKVKGVEEQNRLALYNERKEKLRFMSEKKLKMLERDKQVAEATFIKNKKKNVQSNKYPQILDQNVLPQTEESYLSYNNMANLFQEGTNARPTEKKKLEIETSKLEHSQQYVGISKEIFIPKLKSPMIQRKEYLLKLAKDLGVVGKTHRVIDMRGNSFYSPPLKPLDQSLEEKKATKQHTITLELGDFNDRTLLVKNPNTLPIRAPQKRSQKHSEEFSKIKELFKSSSIENQTSIEGGQDDNRDSISKLPGWGSVE